MTSSWYLIPQHAPRTWCRFDDQTDQGQKRGWKRRQGGRKTVLPPPLSFTQPAAGLANVMATPDTLPTESGKATSEPWLFYSFILWLIPALPVIVLEVPRSLEAPRSSPLTSSPASLPHPTQALTPAASPLPLWACTWLPSAVVSGGDLGFLLSCFVGCHVVVTSY